MVTKCCDWVTVGLLVAIGAWCSQPVMAQTALLPQPGQVAHVHAEPSQAERGITATKTFAFAGRPLRAKVQRDSDAPLVLRLQHEQEKHQYTAHFIGTVSGSYDLRDWLEHADGSAVQGLAPLPVEVVSTLPNDQRSDLFAVDSFQPRLTGGYRWVMSLIVVAWLAIPCGILIRRVLTRKTTDMVSPAAPPVSLIEQLHPLIATAAAGPMSTADKARLELLLLHYWRQQAGQPDQSMADAIQQLRSHDQAGPMLFAVEKWLHESGEPGRDPHSVDASARQTAFERLSSLLEPSQATSASNDQPKLPGSVTS